MGRAKLPPHRQKSSFPLMRTRMSVVPGWSREKAVFSASREFWSKVILKSKKRSPLPSFFASISSSRARPLTPSTTAKTAIFVILLASSFLYSVYPQQPGPAIGPQPETPPTPFEDFPTLMRPKNGTIFLPPHLGQLNCSPFSFSDIEAKISVFSLQFMQMYS